MYERGFLNKIIELVCDYQFISIILMKSDSLPFYKDGSRPALLHWIQNKAFIFARISNSLYIPLLMPTDATFSLRTFVELMSLTACNAFRMGTSAIRIQGIV
jgi:hypothetical protein